jgi:PLD-like domain
MKKTNLIALLLHALFFVNCYGMEPVQRDALPVQVYFTPQDQAEITNNLLALLDNAKQQILIAMYWITDQAIMEKIIAAKKRNVDVQIVIDETTPKSQIVDQLLHNDIVPIVYPSNNPNAAGKMHHKFVVVDTFTVFTGSANFTKAALNPEAIGYNFENVIIFNSNNIAKKYIEAFITMQKTIFDFYVEIIASENPNDLPDWMNHIVPMVYNKQHAMQESVNQKTKNYKLKEQGRIKSFFGMQPVSVKRKNQFIEKTRNMESYWEPATKNQLGLLERMGVPYRDTVNLSKQEASDLIDDIKDAERQLIEEEERNIKRSRYYGR